MPDASSPATHERLDPHHCLKLLPLEVLLLQLVHFGHLLRDFLCVLRRDLFERLRSRDRQDQSVSDCPVCLLHLVLVLVNQPTAPPRLEQLCNRNPTFSLQLWYLLECWFAVAPTDMVEQLLLVAAAANDSVRFGHAFNCHTVINALECRPFHPCIHNCS